jgi:hypothetical protein
MSKEFLLDLRALLSGASTASDQTTANNGGMDVCAREVTLVENARQDPVAFASLYELYFARVYRYLRMWVEHESDAKDITQQVCLQALTALPRYEKRDTPFAVWLFTIARRARRSWPARPQASAAARAGRGAGDGGRAGHGAEPAPARVV